MNKESVLCYIEDSWAYFTTCPLEKQWGDDWNDAPYEHNAGIPYEYREGYIDRGPYTITKVAWDHGDYRVPCDGLINSSFSVEQINRGDIAWLRGASWADKDLSPIHAGTTLSEFCNLIMQSGGEVYIKCENTD